MNSIWNTSLGILARREHSVRELREKLKKRYPDEDLAIEAVIVKLQDLDLQSDTRFAESWFRSQTSLGRGPIRIRGEARMKGVSTLVDNLLEESGLDWFEVAAEVAQRKFPSGIDFKMKAKAYRFLSYRGFESDSILYAINTIAQ